MFSTTVPGHLGAWVETVVSWFHPKPRSGRASIVEGSAGKRIQRGSRIWTCSNTSPASFVLFIAASPVSGAVTLTFICGLELPGELQKLLMPKLHHKLIKLESLGGSQAQYFLKVSEWFQCTQPRMRMTGLEQCLGWSRNLVNWVQWMREWNSGQVRRGLALKLGRAELEKRVRDWSLWSWSVGLRPLFSKTEIYMFIILEWAQV